MSFEGFELNRDDYKVDISSLEDRTNDVSGGQEVLL
jgi:hypothetical protein